MLTGDNMYCCSNELTLSVIIIFFFTGMSGHRSLVEGTG